MAAVLPLAGPKGAALGACIGLISSIFFAEEEDAVEPMEDILKRVITEALQIQTDDELQSAAVGEMAVMIQNAILLSSWMKELDVEVLKQSGVYDTLKAGTYETDGVYFLAKLDFYIKKHISARLSSPDSTGTWE
jgi:hypothetical protein